MHEALGALLTAVTVTTKHCSREVSWAKHERYNPLRLYRAKH